MSAESLVPTPMLLNYDGDGIMRASLRQSEQSIIMPTSPRLHIDRKAGHTPSSMRVTCHQPHPCRQQHAERRSPSEMRRTIVPASSAQRVFSDDSRADDNSRRGRRTPDEIRH